MDPTQGCYQGEPAYKKEVFSLPGIVGASAIRYRSTSPERVETAKKAKGGSPHGKRLARDNDAWGTRERPSGNPFERNSTMSNPFYFSLARRSQHLRIPVDNVSSSMDAPSTHLRAGGPLHTGSKLLALSASILN